LKKEKTIHVPPPFLSPPKPNGRSPFRAGVDGHHTFFFPIGVTFRSRVVLVEGDPHRAWVLTSENHGVSLIFPPSLQASHGVETSFVPFFRRRPRLSPFLFSHPRVFVFSSFSCESFPPISDLLFPVHARVGPLFLYEPPLQIGPLAALLQNLHFFSPDCFSDEPLTS